MKELPLNGFYSGESRKLSDRRCVNFMPTVSDSGSLSSLSLMPTVGREKGKNIDPTYNALADTNVNTANKVKSNSVTWTVNNANSLIFVKDQAVAAISDDITESRLLKYDADTVQPDNERVRITTSPSTLVVVGYARQDSAIASNNYYIQYAENNSFSWQLHPTALSARPIVDAAFYGGRFLYCNYDSEDPKVYYSSLTSPVASNLDFIAPDDNNGYLKGIEVSNNSLYVFGEEKTYIYQVTTNVDLPYRNSGTIDVGLYQPESKIATSRGIYFIGKNGGASYHMYRISGASVQKISTRQIDFRLNENDIYNVYGDTTSGVRPKWPDYIPVFKITDNNESIIVFNTPKGCFCFNEENGMWHERKSQGREDWNVVSYGMSPKGPVFINDTWSDVSLDVYDTNISEVNVHSGLELGELMDRRMVSSPFNLKNNRMVVSELEPQCEVDYSEPVSGWTAAKINISLSYDFGNSFEGERSLSIGESGNYTQRTRFIGVGYVDQSFNIEVRAINPYPVRLLRLLARSTDGSL